MSERKVLVGQSYIHESTNGVYEVLYVCEDQVAVVWKWDGEDRGIFIFSKSNNFIFENSNRKDLKEE